MPCMSERHQVGKALWQEKIIPILAHDAEHGLNQVLDWLEAVPDTDVGWQTFLHLFGEG